MKKFIFFICLIFVSLNYNKLYSNNGNNFYYLDGSEENGYAIMYLHIVENEAFGSYYADNSHFDFHGSIRGNNIMLNLMQYDEATAKSNARGTITGTFDNNKITLNAKRGGNQISLRLSNLKLSSLPILYFYEDIDAYNVFKTRGMQMRFIRQYIIDSDYNINKYVKEINEDLSWYKNFPAFQDYDSLSVDRDKIKPSNLKKSIDYLDEKIIVITTYYEYLIKYVEYATESYFYKEAFYKDTLKKVRVKDFIVNSQSFINYFNKKAAEFNRTAGEVNYFPEIESIDDLDYISFTFTPFRKMIFFVNNESKVWSEIEFTFDELMPFIKDNSPLDYLF